MQPALVQPRHVDNINILDTQSYIGHTVLYWMDSLIGSGLSLQSRHDVSDIVKNTGVSFCGASVEFGYLRGQTHEGPHGTQQGVQQDGQTALYSYQALKQQEVLT